jgi:hypothetical protein
MDVDRDPEMALDSSSNRPSSSLSWSATSGDQNTSFTTPKMRKSPPPLLVFSSSFKNHPRRAEILELMNKRPPRSGACGLFRFDGIEETICGGRVGKDESGMCVRPRTLCLVRSHSSKKAWKGFDSAKPDGAYFIRHAKSPETIHIAPSLPGLVGDSCPIIQRYKDQLASVETWTSLFRMSLENFRLTKEEDKLDLEDADALVAANEDLFGDTFKSGRKKPRITAPLDSPTLNLPSAQKRHNEALVALEDRLLEGEQRIYTLEAVVGEVPEDSPQTSLRAGLANLADRMEALDGQISALEAKVNTQSNSLSSLRQDVERKPSAVSFGPSASDPSKGDIARLRTDQEGLRKAMLELLRMVQILSQKPPAPPSDLERRFTPLSLFHSELASLRATVSSLERKVEITFGGISFRNLQDCKDFLIQHCPHQGQVPVYQCFTTLNSLLQSLGSEVVTEQDSNAEEVTQHKTGKTTAQSRVLASFKSRTPSWLVKNGKEANDDPSNVDPMTAMSSFETWDKQDGISGLVPQALQALKSTYPTLESLIKSTCDGHPMASMIFLEMLSTSFLFLERWFAKTSQFYLRTLLNTHQGPVFTKEQKQSVWDLTKILSRVLFNELSVASACARASSTDEPFSLNALVLWATIQHHAVMKTFKDHDFEGHPEVQPKVLDYLGRNAAPKQSVVSLEKRLAESLDTLNQAVSIAKQAKTTADKALSAVNRPAGGQAPRPPRGNRRAEEKDDS